MGLKETAQEQSKPKGGCILGDWISDLEDEAKADVLEALLDDSIGHTALMRAIKIEYKMEFGRDTVTNHRKRLMGIGGCKCEVSQILPD